MNYDVLINMDNSFISSAFLGTAMPLELSRPDLVVRLVCTLIAGAVIGYNRSEHGKAAGLRTTVLVCLAASVAMLQMNYLLTLTGRTTNSFVMNDLMRLPLGILTGVGFIGGGAILRRGNLVLGVTTAATLWYVTAVGLCFGGGQVLLGWVATMLGCLVLWVFKWWEDAMAVERNARLTITVDEAGPTEYEISRYLESSAIKIFDLRFEVDGRLRTYTLDLRQLRKVTDTMVPPVVEGLSRRAGVVALKWAYAVE